LYVKEVAAAATGLSLRTLGARALSREALFGPKTTLADDLFHPLKPSQIIGVVIWEIERLLGTCQGIDAIAHAWPLWVVCPEVLWILGTLIRQNT